MSDLRKIPGVGPRIEQAIQAIGIACIAELAGRDPEELYRLAVYSAEHPAPDPEKLKWWYWKDVPYCAKGDT